ncbi:hypothetical protein BaRGS_00023289 [Batillaria attramentaria]|uniref:Uncharacterized protein n=1 Tax=Batillaria attramentaria TaxID=370345 RepID=A0ABD0JUK1_9CAEN
MTNLRNDVTGAMSLAPIKPGSEGRWREGGVPTEEDDTGVLHAAILPYPIMHCHQFTPVSSAQVRSESKEGKEGEELWKRKVGG